MEMERPQVRLVQGAAAVHLPLVSTEQQPHRAMAEQERHRPFQEPLQLMLVEVVAVEQRKGQLVVLAEQVVVAMEQLTQIIMA